MAIEVCLTEALWSVQCELAFHLYWRMEVCLTVMMIFRTYEIASSCHCPKKTIRESCRVPAKADIFERVLLGTNKSHSLWESTVRYQKKPQPLNQLGMNTKSNEAILTHGFEAVETIKLKLITNQEEKRREELWLCSLATNKDNF